MQDERLTSRVFGKSVAELLRGLSSADAGAVWVEFLDRYSALIMNSAHQFVYQQDRVNECFLYVCENLSDDGFRRLLKFNPAGKAKFQTWLGIVVFHLGVDWHRKEFGRATLLPAITALPAFDQSVFHLVIELGMDKETCFQTLRVDFPDLTRELVAKAAGRVFSLMTPRQRWQLAVRNRGRKAPMGNTDKDFVERLPDPGFSPETEAQTRQELETLQEAISKLPADQRLLLRLRFQEGLSLKKIAKLQHLGDTNRAWRLVQAATSALFDHVQYKNSAKIRKK
jgi:RNA polymerase sigma factor (sigma-70 family)